MIAGRLPDPHDPFAVAVNELAAEKRHLHVGSRLRLYAYSPAQFQNGGLTASGVEQGNQAPDGPTFTVRVAAIVRSPQDVNAVNPVLAKEGVSYEDEQNLFTTPAFLPAPGRGAGHSGPGNRRHQLRGHPPPSRRRGLAGVLESRQCPRARPDLHLGEAGNVYAIRTAAASAERGFISKSSPCFSSPPWPPW